MRPAAAAVVLLAGGLAAQAPPSDHSAVITPPRLLDRIEILAHDSMMGRDTPSPGLERAAAYVAGELERLGLRPAGDDGGYVQRWGISRWRPDPASSVVELTGPGGRVRLRLGVDTRWAGGAVNGREIAGVILPATTLPADSAAVVALTVDYSRPLPRDLQERVDRLARRAKAVLILSNRDSAAFARRLAISAEPRLTPDFRAGQGGGPVLEIHRRALDRLLEGGALEAGRLHARLRLERELLEHARVPNLVAVLDGSDPLLRREYVAISAHVDGVGLRPGAADSINNGADDNASGLAGLLELAEAFARAGARPRRSLLFLAPSGEEKGLWGSEYFVTHPTVPLRSVVANLNMDLLGRNWTDSVIVVGPEFSTLGVTLEEVVAAHPELRMAPVSDRWPEERIFYRSDHYNFARRGVPILFFTSGTHPDYHQPTDEADRVDVEKASRIVRLVFHLAAAVANDPGRPRWSPESYQRIVQEE